MPKPKPRRRKKPTPRGRTTAVIVTAALVALGAGYLFARPYLRARTPTNANVDATLLISMSGWQPATLHAKAGEPITVRMVNLDNRFHTDGGGWHDFVLPTLGVTKQVAPEKTLTFTITAQAPGEYLYYCDVCCGGKDNPTMQGKLIVS